MASWSLLTEAQKVGLVSTTAGVALLYFGVVMYFDKGLLVAGNALLLAGLALLLGFVETASVLLFRANLYGSALFFGGIFLIFYGFCVLGVLLEMYGAFVLFGSFVPLVMDYLRTLPILVHLLPAAGGKGEGNKVD